MSDEAKYPSEEAERFQIRLPDGFRDQIRAAAEANHRSMNAEIIARLMSTFSLNETTSMKTGRTSQQFNFRMPDEMKGLIQARADGNNRSMNSELVAMLEGVLSGSVANDERLARIEAKLDDLLSR